MSLTAGTVIDSARDFHGALSKQNAPNRLGYPQITRFMNQLMDRLLGRVPAYFAQTYVATINSALLTNGLALSTLSATGVKGLAGDILFRYTSSSPQRHFPGKFIPWEQRQLYTPVPAYTMANNVIYLLAGTVGFDLGTAYQNFDQMTVSFTPNPAAITADISVLTGFPDDALEAFASDLAAFLLRRMVGNPSWEVKRGDVDYYDGLAAEARGRFLTRITRGFAQQQSYYVIDATAG